MKLEVFIVLLVSAMFGLVMGVYGYYFFDSILYWIIQFMLVIFLLVGYIIGSEGGGK